MTIWDFVVLCLIALVGVGLWFDSGSRGLKDWMIKFALISTLLFGPYYFWDDIASYWQSSEEGPVKIEAGWW